MKNKHEGSKVKCDSYLSRNKAEIDRNLYVST